MVAIILNKMTSFPPEKYFYLSPHTLVLQSTRLQYRGTKSQALLGPDHSQINNLRGIILQENIFKILGNNILSPDEIC